MKTGRLIAFAAVGLLMVLTIRFPVLHDNTVQAENKKTILEHADSIEGGQTTAPSGKTEPYRSTIGNVVFLHENATLKCDRATEFPESNRITLEGNISVNDKTVEVYGDKGLYFPDREAGELTSNVRGRFIKDNLVAKAKRAAFSLNANELWLYDDAMVWHLGKQLSGDSILVHVKEINGAKKVDEVQVHGHAFYAAVDSAAVDKRLYDQMSGKIMVIKIDDASHITGIKVTRQARSLRHTYDDNKEPSGVHYSSGDVIRMFFTEGKLQRVLVTGNAEGKQYPKRMRGDRAINLPGFQWRENEMPRFK